MSIDKRSRRIAVAVAFGALCGIAAIGNCGNAPTATSSAPASGPTTDPREARLELLKRAVNDASRARSDAALIELKNIYQLGEAYSLMDGVVKSDDGSASMTGKEAALMQYQKILDFPMFEQPYWSRPREFETIYIRACLRVVALTPTAELKTLHFHPFAFEAIKETFPDKHDDISGVPPDMWQIRHKVLSWLNVKLKDEPNTSAIYPHLKAVAEYVGKLADE